jgi:cyclophilin family peptidyl-prolyl cis-trans isomerase
MRYSVIIRRKSGWVAIVVASFVLGALLTAPGCGTKTETQSEAGTASIPGPAKAKETTTVTAAKEAKPAVTKSDPLHPVIVIDTSLGPITVTLDREKAYVTVDHFLWNVNRGQYDQTIFHQVLKDHAILGGGFTPGMKEKPAPRTIHNEANNGLKNVRGTIGMVRRPDVINSATCQLYINLAENKNLDYQGETPEKYGYCVFGQVDPESMPVVDKIAAVPVRDEGDFERTPVQPVVINKLIQAR